MDEKIELNRKKIAELEALAKTIYDYLLANTKYGYKPLKELLTVKTGKQDSNFSSVDGQYRFFTCSKEILWCNEFQFEGRAILLAGNGDLHVRYYEGRFNAYQRTYVLMPNDSQMFASVYFAVQAMLLRLRNGASGSIVKFITKGDVEQITVPLFKDKQRNLLNILLLRALDLGLDIINLTHQRDTLLPLLMNGQVLVN